MASPPTKQTTKQTTKPTVRPYFFCEICEQIHPRKSNVQKYCEKCRAYATSLKVAEYYQRHRQRILKDRAAYREANRQQLRQKSRAYYAETRSG